MLPVVATAPAPAAAPTPPAVEFEAYSDGKTLVVITPGTMTVNGKSTFDVTDKTTTGFKVSKGYGGGSATYVPEGIKWKVNKVYKSVEVSPDDTPDWNNNKGYDCAAYSLQGWCKGGNFGPTFEWTGTPGVVHDFCEGGDCGPSFNYPSENCFVCGKACRSQAPSDNCAGVAAADCSKYYDSQQGGQICRTDQSTKKCAGYTSGWASVVKCEAGAPAPAPAAAVLLQQRRLGSTADDVGRQRSERRDGALRGSARKSRQRAGDGVPVDAAHAAWLADPPSVAWLGAFLGEPTGHQMLVLPEVDKTVFVHVNPKDLISPLVAGGAFFEYQGSMTAPPCTEQVAWLVRREPLLATSNQIDLLQNAIRQSNSGVGNYRSTMPVMGRILSVRYGVNGQPPLKSEGDRNVTGPSTFMNLKSEAVARQAYGWASQAATMANALGLAISNSEAATAGAEASLDTNAASALTVTPAEAAQAVDMATANMGPSPAAWNSNYGNMAMPPQQQINR